MSETLVPIADDSSAVLYNPAGLPQVGRFEGAVSFARGFWFEDFDRYVYEATIAVPIGSRVGLGIGFGSNQMKYEYYEAEDSLGNLSAWGAITESDNTGIIGLGVALDSAKSFLLGGGVRIYRDLIELGGYSSKSWNGNGFGGDLGFIWKTDLSSDRYQMRVGIALQDIAGTIGGYDLPIQGRLGVALYSPDNIAVALKLQRNDLASSTSGNTIGLGFEKNLFKGVWALRAGMDYHTISRANTYKSSIEDNVKYSIGTGIKVGLVGLDYAFSYQRLGFLGDVYMHHVTISALIGEKKGGKVAEGERRARARPEPERRERVKRAPRDPNAPRLNIAVAELGAENVTAGDSAVIANILRGELVKSDIFTVVEKQNMDKILSEQSFQKSGCTTEECAVKLGRILNVQRIVVGSFGKLMGRYFINIRMVNVETGKVDYADRARGDTVDQIENGIVDIADRLGEEATKQPE